MSQLIIRELATADYQSIWEAMRRFTQERNDQTVDELWLVEHHPVFTQGLAGKSEHLIQPQQIPVIQTDRGGQVTYHGPGQLVAYPLIDLKRMKISIRQLVSSLEQTVINLLSALGISAHARCEAPGVYINTTKKICSIGLRVSRGCSYHGIALNVAMDLTPFSFINPCGFKDLTMTQVSDFCPLQSVATIHQPFIEAFIQQFGYTQADYLSKDDNKIQTLISSPTLTDGKSETVCD